MERYIKSLISSYIAKPEKTYLDAIDDKLLYLLFKKEVAQLCGPKTKKSIELGRLCDKYLGYNSIIHKAISPAGRYAQDGVFSNIFSEPSRLVILLTHKCQLRCAYCRVRKFSKTMTRDTLKKAVRLLFTSQKQEIQLQFFGGEPLLRFDLIKEAVSYAEEMNKEKKKDLTFILTTNGLALNADKIRYLRGHNFLVECSLDGPSHSQLASRGALDNKDYFKRVIKNYKMLISTEIPHYAISVISPGNIAELGPNLKYLMNTGFKSIQLNYALGVYWPDPAMDALFKETAALTGELRRNGVQFINLTRARREPAILNAEISVDTDGGLFWEYGICLEEDFFEMKKKFYIGDIKRVRGLVGLSTTPFQNFHKLMRVYGARNKKFSKIILNNIFLGFTYERFLKGL
ncbi:MAG TPA: hypothetical protein DCL35_02585 [Candidatus Omnitrophica bacterium]|nr:hypothetical protein [Candidatus Omnitrophota bacterium]